MLRRVYARDGGAAETFFAGQVAWVGNVLMELGAGETGGEVLRRVRSSFVRMAVRGLDGGEQTEAQLRRTIRSICEIQCEGARLELRGFFKAYAEKDLDAAKEIFNGLHRVLRDGLVRKIRRRNAHEGEEEILQRVFFALWEHLGAFVLAGSWHSMVKWVHVVLARQTAQWWREQDHRALGRGEARRLTRPILPDDAAFDWNDPEVLNAWLAGAIEEAARSVEERYLVDPEGEGAEEAQMDREVNGAMSSHGLDRSGDCEAEGDARADDSGADTHADKGLDVDEANGLGHGSYAASLRAAEAWRQGVAVMLEQPIEVVLAPLEVLVGRNVLARAAEAIKGLPAEQQKAFRAWLILRVVRGSSGGEIAAFLGVNYSTFRGWLRKARQAVAEALGQSAPPADADGDESGIRTGGGPGHCYSDAEA